MQGLVSKAVELVIVSARLWGPTIFTLVVKTRWTSVPLPPSSDGSVSSRVREANEELLENGKGDKSNYWCFLGRPRG